MSTANAFNWRAFVQPVRPAVSIVNAVGQMRVAPTKPVRKVVQVDAPGTRRALNSAGRFVQVRMDVHSTSIAPKSDQWGEYE